MSWKMYLLSSTAILMGCSSPSPDGHHSDRFSPQVHGEATWVAKLVAFTKADIELQSFTGSFKEANYGQRILEVLRSHPDQFPNKISKVSFNVSAESPDDQLRDSSRFRHFDVTVQWDVEGQTQLASFEVGAFMMRRGVDWYPIFLPTLREGQLDLYPDQVNILQYLALHLHQEKLGATLQLSREMLSKDQRDVLARAGFREYSAFNVHITKSTTTLTNRKTGMAYSFDWESGYPRNILHKMSTSKH
jgi:hypothetical protein